MDLDDVEPSSGRGRPRRATSDDEEVALRRKNKKTAWEQKKKQARPISWTAQIHVPGQGKVHLGTFRTREEAAAEQLC